MKRDGSCGLLAIGRRRVPRRVPFTASTASSLGAQRLDGLLAADDEHAVEVRTEGPRAVRPASLRLPGFGHALTRSRRGRRRVEHRARRLYVRQGIPRKLAGQVETAACGILARGERRTRRWRK